MRESTATDDLASGSIRPQFSFVVGLLARAGLKVVARTQTDKCVPCLIVRSWPNPGDPRLDQIIAMDHSQMTPDAFVKETFDFLVVGGGTAGLVVAARLSERLGLTVGVLEAGEPATGDGAVESPGLAGRALGSVLDWQFATVPQPGLRGREMPWARGKVLGGSSALNYMTWNRAARQDYDDWKELGNAGWGWDDLLSVFSFPFLLFVQPQSSLDYRKACRRIGLRFARGYRFLLFLVVPPHFAKHSTLGKAQSGSGSRLLIGSPGRSSKRAKPVTHRMKSQRR